MRNTIAVSVATLSVLIFTLGIAADNAPPPAETFPPRWMIEPSFPSSNWEHLRLDEPEIARIGGGSFEKGLNLIGGGGFKLFTVTTANEQGGPGWHIFKRPAWNAPGPRPRFEYKRIDTVSIETLGNGNFAEGMKKVEQEHWELVALTTIKNGGIGWFYFEKPVAGN
jgi:hypothetical protein